MLLRSSESHIVKRKQVKPARRAPRSGWLDVVKLSEPSQWGVQTKFAAPAPGEGGVWGRAPNSSARLLKEQAEAEAFFAVITIHFEINSSTLLHIHKGSFRSPRGSRDF